MRVAVVWNPSKTEREDLEQALSAADPSAEISWFETSEDDPGQEIAKEALAISPDALLVAGGDGTVRAVAETLAVTEDAPPLGILPLGTGNLLARNLEVPLNVKDAAARALSGSPRTIDFGWVEIDDASDDERHGFAVMVGFGVDANMIAETNDDLKAKAGWLAYVESLGRAVSASEVVHATVTLDDEKQDVEAHTIIVGNCGTIQGGVTLLPDAAPDDGALDVLMLSAEGVGGWLDTMKTMVWDNGLRKLLPGGEEEDTASTETTTYAQARSVTVDLPDARPFQIDGEEVGEIRRFRIQIQPDALRVL